MRRDLIKEIWTIKSRRPLPDTHLYHLPLIIHRTGKHLPLKRHPTAPIVRVDGVLFYIRHIILRSCRTAEDKEICKSWYYHFEERDYAVVILENDSGWWTLACRKMKKDKPWWEEEE